MPIVAPVSLSGPAALRAFARAFGQFNDFDRFVLGLKAALERSEPFARMRIMLDRELAERAERFPAGTMSFPLLGPGGSIGALQAGAGGERRQFSAEDLHLMTGLADFLGVALTQAQDAQRGRELLRFLLNQAPVGLAAYGPDRRPIVANDLAVAWISQTEIPFQEIEKGATSFHLRSSGKLIFGEARKTPDGAWVLALHDCTPAQVQLLETLQREVYRGLWERRSLTLLLIESSSIQQGVVRRLPALRATLMDAGVVGPYDAHRVGVVLPGAGAVQGRRRLRDWMAICEGIPGLRAGWAELGRDGASSEALLEAALKRGGPLREIAKPAVLVQEGNDGVAGAIQLLLREECRVVRSDGVTSTREFLQREEFDLLIAEMEPRVGPPGAQLLVEAREKQPALKALFTSVAAAGEGLPAPPAAEGVPVLQKPFAPDELRQAVRLRMET